MRPNNERIKKKHGINLLEQSKNDPLVPNTNRFLDNNVEDRRSIK